MIDTCMYDHDELVLTIGVDILSQDFHFGVLLAYNDGSSRSEIVKVNLLSSMLEEDGGAENADHSCGVSRSAMGV